MLCQLCHKNTSQQKHHLFSRTKWALKLYGAKLLDDPRNVLYVCEACHLWKPIPKFTELEFCQALDIQPLSKKYQFITFKK